MASDSSRTTRSNSVSSTGSEGETLGRRPSLLSSSPLAGLFVRNPFSQAPAPIPAPPQPAPPPHILALHSPPKTPLASIRGILSSKLGEQEPKSDLTKLAVDTSLKGEEEKHGGRPITPMGKKIFAGGFDMNTY
ncbi:hypothetical protein M427DRAFT_66107 [Gonapodya prolifera JEL478]|uniref:Uncharacterized protein n=1 Tax=Gonapodya prolifera (strain JEL478) TaxID=1344416 RepID=A0A139AXG0_GONPJ|nr:hypothetical protein M427DRAFT_66107 [Gonapodya prolifera JEL478]|eukprot:KXS21399.1 hypothetical protein M427DRAFT_66107 [Gonapodya prolifera JEL478]